MSETPASTNDTLAATEAPSSVDDATQEARRRTTGDVLPQGEVVGRYVVLNRLGAGGMGVVYAAYDPELDRKVALKLLLPGHGGSEGRTRLLREAQALAKLQHPNVVTIHDVGTHDHRVWLAMEFVEGETLGDWRAEKPRAWRDVLDVLVRAGRGVVAAHAAGLLHRDLKPDNIMVGVDGRVRVMDFGLARPQQRTNSSLTTTLDGATSSKLEALELRLTQSGALMGTPAYMAPEQLRDGSLGPATDQFSYCVTLWEALYGARPFAGETLIDLALAVLNGKRAPSTGATVPRWLRRVLDRGLSVEPEARWPSMDALIDALARGRGQARWRRGFAVASLLGLSVAAIAGWQEVDQRNRIAGCEEAGASIGDVWNDESGDTVRAALVGTGMSYAAATADQVVPWLDAHARAWETARTEACLDTNVRGKWDADVYDRSLWCLDERRMEFGALVAELERGEATGVERAVQAAAELDLVESCLQPDLLQRLPSPPKERRDEVRAVRVELSRATALERTGAYEEGLAVARDTLERAERLAWPPLIAEARLVLGELLDRTGAYAAAEETLEAAYFEAATGGASDVATAAAHQLVSIVGHQLARHADGRRWSRHAQVALATLPDVAQTGMAVHLLSLALVHDAMGEYEEARTLYQRALAIREEALGPDHPEVATSLHNLATVHDAMGSYAEAKMLHERALNIRENTFGPDHPLVASSVDSLANVYRVTGSHEKARELYERALAIREQALGPDHHHIARSLNNLAAVHYATGAYAKSVALHERAISIWEKALGPDHPEVAGGLNNLATVHYATGSHGEARALYERALVIREKVLGPDHPDVAASLNNLATLDYAAGSHDEAKALFERALIIREKALGSDHLDVAASLNNLAAVHNGLGAHSEAKALYERALVIDEKVLGPDHPDLTYTLLGLADIAHGQGRMADAVALSERAMNVRENAGRPATEVAESSFFLARMLWKADRERSRAIALAERARDAYREAGPSKAAAFANVSAWLEHKEAK